ncbi:hypothetical protein TNCV_2903761 [Trichonephila clavipes]|nr:hypothetical protein TNCV_2903761 [Trichonephila clavipes]
MEVSVSEKIEKNVLNIVIKVLGVIVWVPNGYMTRTTLDRGDVWYWARTRDKASHGPIPIPLGYRGHTPATQNMKKSLKFLKLTPRASDDSQIKEEKACSSPRCGGSTKLF